MKRNLKQILLLAFLIALIYVSVGLVKTNDNRAGEVTETDTTAVEALSASLSIDGLYQDELVAIEAGETALSVLEKLNNENPGLQLVTKDFGEMGVLVDAMGGRVNGTDNQYWQYEVNGEAPMIGADAYKLEGGDSVVWEFKASEY